MKCLDEYILHHQSNRYLDPILNIGNINRALQNIKIYSHRNNLFYSKIPY